MKTIDKGEFDKIISTSKGRVILKERIFEFMDLSGYDLSGVELVDCDLSGLILESVNFSKALLKNTVMNNCQLKNSNFTNANLMAASFRFSDMENVNIENANLFRAILEDANLNNIKYNSGTKWFELHCPKEGAFLAYKKCFNDLIVRLLISEDAKRSSATLNSCRCSKAKVLDIENFSGTEKYEEAWSLIDSNFCYKKGEWVEVDDFNENRWKDSTTGIHFWLTREEAMKY